MLAKSNLAILIGLFTTTNIVHAMDYNPSQNARWGVDLQYTFAKGKDNWEKIFRSKQPGFNTYLGYDFNKWVGLDIGAWWTKRRTINRTIGSGTPIFGIVTNTSSLVSSKIRHRSIYLDLNLYSASYKQINLLAKIGASYFWQHPNVTISPAGNNLDNITSVVKGKNKLVPQLGLGIEGMFSDNWGIRALFQYDIINKNKFNYINPPYNKAFKNASTFSLGVYRKFDFAVLLPNF